MNKAREYFLFFAVFGLTIISLSAGFDFYRSLFGLSTAILCCVIFESIRLGSLWAFMFLEKLKIVVAIPAYALVALSCAFAGITSFHARIIESHNEATRPLAKEMAKRIEMIKRMYAQNVSAQLKILDDKIDVCNRKLAWSPTSGYWQNRRAQLNAERVELVTDRDQFLDMVPQGDEGSWVSLNASVLGVALEPLPINIGGSTATTQAIQELWGVNELHAKKITAFVIVMTIELGIILLTLLTKRNPGRTIASVPGDDLFGYLRERFERQEIKKFLEKCQACIDKHDRLPLAREVGKRQRAIRKIIVESSLSAEGVSRLLNRLG